MAYADTQVAPFNIRHMFAHPFVAIGNFMRRFAEAKAMAQAANRVFEMSDDQLAAQGLTKAEAIDALFAK